MIELARKVEFSIVHLNLSNSYHFVDFIMNMKYL